MIANKEFINIVKQTLPEYKVIESFKTSNDKIKVKDKFGNIYEVRAYSLMQGITPSIKSCLDKTKYFIQKSKLIHGNKYNYDKTKYIKYFDKVIITCDKHGDFLQTPNSHLQGNNCKKCGLENTFKYMINNPAGYNYNNWIKRANKSKHFDSFKIYIVKCWDNNETFFKIGKTYHKVERRLGKTFTKRLPYNYEILKVIKGDGLQICKLEKKLQKLNKNYKYLPKKHFHGLRECFSMVQINK